MSCGTLWQPASSGSERRTARSHDGCFYADLEPSFDGSQRGSLMNENTSSFYWLRALHFTPSGPYVFMRAYGWKCWWYLRPYPLRNRSPDYCYNPGVPYPPPTAGAHMLGLMSRAHGWRGSSMVKRMGTRNRQGAPHISHFSHAYKTLTGSSLIIM